MVLKWNGVGIQFSNVFKYANGNTNSAYPDQNAPEGAV